MQTSIFLAALLFAVKGFANPCGPTCESLVSRCCQNQQNACDALYSCGANSITTACSNPSDACFHYCNSGAVGCLEGLSG